MLIRDAAVALAGELQGQAGLANSSQALSPAVRPDIPGGGAGVEEENSRFQRRQILNT